LTYVPFNRPTLAGNEFDYIRQAIAAMHISGNGPFTQKCQAVLEKTMGVPKVLLTTSCTAALEMAALLLDIQPGDEIIVPSFTFVSTANAFVLRGARPVFIDIHPKTLNLDEGQLERLITAKTRAIIAVHYGGVGCEMEPILQIARHHGIAVVEDNAHGLFGKYRNRFLGTFGCLATQSFHETKNITCGEGGALFINDPGFIERAEILWEKGTDRTRFFRGQVDKYTWVDVGSSYLPSDLLAAFLYAQLEGQMKIQEKRKRIWGTYKEQLWEWACRHEVHLPTVPSYCEPACHLFHIILPSHAVRQDLIKHLQQKGVNTVFHYLPLHLSPMGRRFGGKQGDCPVTETISERLLRLPFFNDLSEADQTYVVTQILEFT
jgi:dTDP-4-amino-4,6-dideoxygalactose transaminase